MHFTKEEKAMWLDDWRRSGKNAWTYAKENGLIPQTFCRWTKGETETKSGFVQILLQSIPSPQGLFEILIEKGDLKIHIPLKMGSGELRAVIQELGSVL
jgi:hypothetical protein